TYALSRLRTTSSGRLPVFSVRITLSLTICDSVPASALLTQTVFPSDATATPLGPSPTVITARTAFELGSIRETVPSRLLATQIPSRLVAIASAPLPTLIVAVSIPVEGSIRETLPANSLVTQTAPSPTA